MVEQGLIRKILPEYVLPLMGIHGLPHWGRVLETGLRLARRTGADPRIVALFSVFHDSRRENEGTDLDHGRRGAALAARFRASLDLGDEQFELLSFACTYHTEGFIEGDVTVQTCWDSDRLDLWRVGITPRSSRLCTEQVLDRDLQTWAKGRSVSGHVPPCD